MKTFPPFRIDAGNQCLWRAEQRILLPPKTFAVLNYLVEHAGRIVSQEELLEALWPGTYVQHEVLRKYILEIRKVLEDPPKAPRFIATLPKRGYQFIAAVLEESAGALMPAESHPSLIGRGPALQDLTGLFRAAERGQRQVVFLAGEPGIGKTALVDAFQLQCAQTERIQIARGQCVEGFSGREAYYPILDALGQLIRGPQRETVIETLATQAPTWLNQFPFAIKVEQRERLQREILGATRERMVRELCEALESLVAERPLLLVLEDLHWVDSSTLDVMSAFARRRGPAKVMILATYRPMEVILSGAPLRMLKQDLLVHRLGHEMNLERLSEAEVEEYLSGRFPESGLSRLLTPMIYRRSEGNPLFLGAMVDQLIEKQMVADQSGRWVMATPMDRLDPGIPDTLQQMLEVQLSQLGAEEQRLLKTASVGGKRFCTRGVSAMMESDPGHVEEMFEALAGRQQFIRPGGVKELPDGSVSAQYDFKHALYREVLYRQLPAIQRGQSHLRLAHWMERLSAPDDPVQASELASHFEAGHDYQRAARYLILVAGIAARRYAHADSIQLLRHALELLPRIPADLRAALELEILERISDALYAQGEMAQSAEVDHQAAELAGRSGMKAAQVNALTRLARALAFVDPDRCVSVCERALEVSRSHHDPLLEARTEMLTACWRIVTNGWRKEDSEVCERARAKIRELSDEVPAYYEILYAHVQCTQGDFEGACRTAASGIARAIETDNLVVYLSAHSSMIQALSHIGRLGELRRVIQSAVDVVEKNGNAPWQGIFKAKLAWLQFVACDFKAARGTAEDLLELHTEEPAGQVRTEALIASGFAHLEFGDARRAAGHFRQVCERQHRPRFFFDWYWRMIARLGSSWASLALGDVSKAASDAEAFFSAAMAGADPALQATAWETKARISAQQGDMEAALGSISRALALLETVHIPTVAWRVHASAAALHRQRGDARNAEHHRSRAASILQSLADSMEAADPLLAILVAAPVERGLAGRVSSGST